MILNLELICTAVGSRFRSTIVLTFCVAAALLASPLAATAASTLHIGIDAAGLGTGDPHFAASRNDRIVADMVFNGLLRFRPGQAPLIEPDLAEAIPEPKIVGGRQEWIFHIRRNVMCHAGPETPAYELGADDVVYSLRKSADPERSAYAGEYTGMTVEKVELGRRLFYELNLAGPSYMSCATCHDPSKAFTDGRPVAIGITGEFHPRNSMALQNVAYHAVLTWADPATVSLERQMLTPMFGQHPEEMAVTGFEGRVLDYLTHDPIYPGLFAAAFPDRAGAIDFDAITMAIAAFERTLVSADAPYDRYRYAGDEAALSEAAKRGADLFNSERLACGYCHTGLHLTDAIPEPRFHNTGLYNIDGAGTLPEDNQGLIEHTGRAEDMGKFRTPMLRNVALTAPYMHDGSLATLDAVVDHYAAGGESARTGTRSPLGSPLVMGFELSAGEKADLIAFLESLTDETFLSDPDIRSPFP